MGFSDDVSAFDTTAGNLGESADAWLASELDRIWLLAERALRALQRNQLRPPPNHPMMAELEAMFATRRRARGATPGPEDELTLLRAIEAANAGIAQVRAAAPLDAVARNLELRPLEIETLVVALAPHVDPALADVFNVLKGPSPAKRGVDLALVAQLFRLSRTDRLALLDALDPARPLLRWRMIHVLANESLEAFSSMTHRAIKPTFDIVSTLCGRGGLSPELERVTQLVSAQPTVDDLQLADPSRREVASICAAVRADRGGDRPWIVLWGPAGIGKRTIAARIAAHAGRPLLAFDPRSIERPVFDELFARVQGEAQVRGAVLYIGALSGGILANGGHEIVRRLRGYPGDVILGIEDTQPPRMTADRPLWELQLSLPAEPERMKLWERAVPVGHRAPELQLSAIARAFRLTPGEIELAAREAIAVVEREQGRKVTHADVRAGVDRRLRNDLGDLAHRIAPRGSWQDLVLPAEDLDRVEELISRHKYHDVVYRSWGYGDRVGYGKGLIALFSGPPGTGKTMLASLIAQSLDLDLYQVDLSSVVSRYVGDTEKQLAKVFDQAERAHAILLFDEADSLFAKRTQVNGSNDRFANNTVNFLLQRLEQYAGVAVLTTNKDAALDEALQRRLSLHLRLDIPEVEERERLWQSFLPRQAPVRHGIDLTVLAREFELSGGYIKNAAVRAAFLAAAAGGAIDMEILRLASALELQDMGRVVCQRTAA